MRNFTNGNTITGNDLTYLKYWLAASGGGGEGYMILILYIIKMA